MGLPRVLTTQPKRAGLTGDVSDLASTLDRVALLYKTIVTEDEGTDIVGFQVKANASYTRQEFYHLYKSEESAK